MSDVIIPEEEARTAIIARVVSELPFLTPEVIETGLGVVSFANQVLAAVGGHFARYELSQARFSVLMALRYVPEHRWVPSALADFLGVRRATLTGILKSLEKDAWIQRTPNAEDARSVEITLTEKGRERFDTLQPDHFRRFAAALETVTAEERAVFMRLLPKMGKVFKALLEDTEAPKK